MLTPTHPPFSLFHCVSHFPQQQVAQLTDALKEAKAAEKEVRGEAGGVLREGRAAQQALAAAEAAAEKAVSMCVFTEGCVIGGMGLFVAWLRAGGWVCRRAARVEKRSGEGQSACSESLEGCA